MRRVLIAMALAAVTMVADGARPEKAHCAFCSNQPCFQSSMCFRGCFCMKRGGEPEGQCFSVSEAPAGWERVP